MGNKLKVPPIGDEKPVVVNWDKHPRLTYATVNKSGLVTAHELPPLKYPEGDGADMWVSNGDWKDLGVTVERPDWGQLCFHRFNRP